MTMSLPIRLFTAVAGLLLLGGSPAQAQRGGGMGGPGGGGRGGGMGMSGGSHFMGDRGASPVNRPAPLHGPQLGLPGRWWNDGHTAKQFNLTTDQQHRMDEIFSANKSALVGALTNLQREERNLTSMSAHELQDEARVYAAIDRVSAARAELEKQDAHILMQIRQQLDPTQLAALDREIAAGRSALP